MTIYTCDRCKAVIGTWRDKKRVTYGYGGFYTQYDEAFDLCTPCFEKFQQFMKGK